MGRYTFDPNGDVLFTLQAGAPGPCGNIDADGLGLDKKCRKRKRNSETDGAGEEVTENGESYEMLVSSRHLMLHSAVFRAMLQPKFAEGAALQKTGSSGHITIPLVDDDPYALAVIMTIIHCQLEKVPTDIALHQLTHIAVIADKYDLKDAINYFAQLWIKPLEEYGFPKVPCYPHECPRLQPWLCIGWVFKMPFIFNAATKLAIQHYDEKMSDKSHPGYPEDLPIPQAVFDNIQHARTDGIAKALKLLDRIIQKYQDDRYTYCSGFQRKRFTLNDSLEAKICDCTTLGGLIKSASKNKLYPAPPRPFDRWTYKEVADKIKSIGKAVPSYCLTLHSASDGKVGSEESCHKLGSQFASVIDLITMSRELQGFDLESVLSKP